MFQPFDRSRSPSFNRQLLDDPQVHSADCWKELRIFLAVAKAMSFNRAAKQLGLTHPTVASSVKRLQDVMRAQLLISTARGIVLTDKGMELARTLVELDDRLSLLSRSLRAEKNDAGGLVRISVTEAIAGLFIVPQIPAFNDEFPHVQLHLQNPINLERFTENQCDIAVRFTPAPESDIVSQPLGVTHFVPVASAAYFAKFGIPTRDTLNQHHFVDSEYYCLTKPPWDEWRKVVEKGKTAHLCDNSYAYAFMVRAGLGIGLLGSYALNDPTLVYLDLDLHIKLPIYLQVPAERLKARPVKATFDWLCAMFGPNIPNFAPTLSFESNIKLANVLAETYEIAAFPMKARA